MNAMMMMNQSTLIGYSNVSYETYISAGYTYYVPVRDVHFYSISYPVTGYCNSGFELYGDYLNKWYSSNEVGMIISANLSYPYGNLWGRNYQNETWQPSGNQGTKTLLEWNSLQQDVTNGTKRNLVGTPVYS